MNGQCLLYMMHDVGLDKIGSYFWMDISAHCSVLSFPLNQMWLYPGFHHDHSSLAFALMSAMAVKGLRWSLASSISWSNICLVVARVHVKCEYLVSCYIYVVCIARTSVPGNMTATPHQ